MQWKTEIILSKWLLQSYMKYNMFTDKFFLLWFLCNTLRNNKTNYISPSFSISGVEVVRSWKMAQMSANHLLLRRLTATAHVYEVWWKSLREKVSELIICSLAKWYTLMMGGSVHILKLFSLFTCKMIELIVGPL